MRTILKDMGYLLDVEKDKWFASAIETEACGEAGPDKSFARNRGVHVVRFDKHSDVSLVISGVFTRHVADVPEALLAKIVDVGTLPRQGVAKFFKRLVWQM